MDTNNARNMQTLVYASYASIKLIFKTIKLIELTDILVPFFVF